MTSPYMGNQRPTIVMEVAPQADQESAGELPLKWYLHLCGWGGGHDLYVICMGIGKIIHP